MLVPISFMKAFPFKKLLAILAVILVLGIVRDLIIQTAIPVIGSSVLGAKIRLQRFSMSLMLQKVSIRSLQIGQPPEFSDQELLADIPEITMQFNALGLVRGRLHFPLMVLHLRELTVIKDHEGKLNVERLKLMQDVRRSAEEAPQEATGDDSAPSFGLRIDSLKLNIGKIIFKDYSKHATPKILVYDVNTEKNFQNVNSIPQLVTVVLYTAVGETAIKSAGLYAASALLGVGFLPAGIMGIVVGDDNAAQTFKVGLDKAYTIALNFMKDSGKVTKEDRKNGLISGVIQGLTVKFRLEKAGWGQTKITVTARKHLLPKAAEAGGILHQVSQRF